MHAPFLCSPSARKAQLVRRVATGAGFTYVSVLILTAIISLTATATIGIGAIAERRAAEEELLAIGQEFRQALASYALATPEGHKQAPSSLQELLKDERSPQLLRHLRRLYADPLTGEEKWGLVLAPDGSGIVGIHSLSEATPIKIGNFEPALQHFTDQPSYRRWVFTAAQ
jgi:type II secretory pathway pseudopilin PulG